MNDNILYKTPEQCQKALRARAWFTTGIGCSVCGTDAGCFYQLFNYNKVPAKFLAFVHENCWNKLAIDDKGSLLSALCEIKEMNI